MARKEKWRVLTNPSKKEFDAQRIEIECVENPKEDDGYIVTVYPKTNQSKPGKTQKNPPYIYTNPIKRVFASEDAVIEYLEKVL